MNRKRFTAWLLIAALMTGISACGSVNIKDIIPAGENAGGTAGENAGENAGGTAVENADDHSDGILGGLFSLLPFGGDEDSGDSSGGLFSFLPFGKDKDPGTGSGDLFSGLLSGAGKGPTEEVGAPVTMDNGAVVFIPGSKDIAQDKETGIRYIKGMILAYTTAEPDDAMMEKLAGEAGGTIVGIQKGTVPLVEIRTGAADYAELEALSEKIAALPEVLLAYPEVELNIGVETVNTLTEDLTPWSAEEGSVIKDKGDENHPSGNDWWAEAIRAYSAWEATPDLTDPIPLGIIDNGTDKDHPELRGRIFTDQLSDISLDNNNVSHGTFVAGVAAASGGDRIGIRGVADRSDIYCADHSNKTYYTYTQGIAGLATYTAYPALLTQYYGTMHQNGVRVVNHSFGNNYMLTFEEYSTLDKRKDAEDLRESLSVYDSYDDFYDGQILIGKASARWLLGYMLAKLINGEEDFLYVQSAGNGSMYDDTPVSSDLNLYFCSITEDIFNDQINKLKANKAVTPEQRERLEKLKWEDLRDHYMIVGGSSSEQLSETEYAPYEHGNAGENVDICAPATDIFGINTQTVEAEKHYVTESGTSVAAPMVTGAATLLWSVAPELPAREIKKILTECSDKTVADPFGEEHPLLNIGLAVEYTKYYMYVRDVMIPKYGLQKGAQEGTPQNSQESWLEPEGIVTAWIGNMDGLTGDEMVVFRFERDPDSDYSNRRYCLMMDLFTIYDGQVRLMDTVKTDFSLSKKYTMDLDMHVTAAPRGDWTDILIEIDEKETDLYGSDRHISRVVTSDGEKLSVQDGDTSGYETKKRIFDISNENNRADKSRDHFTFLVTDGCRLTWYLDFVFTDRDYMPAGYVSEYAPAAAPAAAVSAEEAVRGALWDNPANLSGEPRLLRTEDYKEGGLDSFDQYAYDENGLLLYKGYFHKEGDLSSIIRYEYDDAGGLIRESEILANGKTQNVFSYENDDRGNQVRKSFIPEGGGEITDWNEYEYDDAGNQVKWLGYRKKELSFYWEYSYDADGNRIEWARYEADGTRTQAERREYDGAGHILNSYGMDDDGNFKVNATYEWSDDFHTRRSPWFHSNNGSLAGYDIYTFDDYGNTLSFTVQNTDGAVTSRRLYYYDNGASGSGASPAAGLKSGTQAAGAASAGAAKSGAAAASSAQSAAAGTAKTAKAGGEKAADGFHLTIEEAQRNAKLISGRSFLQPDGNMLCDLEYLTQWSRAMKATGGKIKMIHNDHYIDQDDHAHQQWDFTMYDDARVSWICNSEVSAAVSTDHRLLMSDGYAGRIPEIDDAVMADEADRVVAVLHTDGTVTTYSVATDYNPSQYDWNIDLSCLKDIVQMQICVMMPENSGDAWIPCIIGLKSDGTMVSTAGYPKELSEWTDIVGFTVRDRGVIGWKGDGTLTACGKAVFNDKEMKHIDEYRHIRYFDTGRSVFSAVSDDGYALGEIQFSSKHVAPDGSYEYNEYAPIPSYEEWLEGKR